MFSIEQLRAFVAVAEHLHFGNAARELRMTQPPLSRQIQRLEADLGVQLLVRTNRRVELTPPGQVFLVRARALLDLAEESRATARRAARGERGRLSVGFTAGSSLAVLGDLLSAWERRLPDVDIDLHERVSQQQLEDLTRYRLDLGLLRTLPEEEDGFGSALILTEDLVVALPRAHPLADRGDPLGVDDLAGHRMIGYTRPDSEYFLHKIETLFGERRPPERVAVSQLLSIVSLVATGFGFALVPRSTSRIGVDGVVYRELAPPPGLAAAARVSVHAVWRLDSGNPVLHRALRALPGNGPADPAGG